MIEIKIPKEITEYKEKFLFGLTVRQFISVAAALAVCVPLYIFGKDYLGDDATSWLVILFAVPIFGFGFVKYNGMTAEKFIWAWIKSEFLMPKKLVFHSTNTYYELMKPTIEQKQKEAYKNND